MFFAAATVDSTQSWKTSVQPNGLRTIQTSGTATTPDGNFPATFAFECQPGKDGTISFVYTIDHANQMKLFNFDEFEGPDALAAERETAHLQASSKGSTSKLDKAVSGYYATGEAFAFSFSVLNGKRNNVTKFLDKVMSGAENISICIQSVTKRKICSQFNVKDAADSIRQTVKSCYQAKFEK
jgi:hypothetical protein